MRQLVYTMFITNNRSSFHLWWKEILVKCQKVSKCYEHDCRRKITLMIWPLLSLGKSVSSNIHQLDQLHENNILLSIPWNNYNSWEGPILSLSENKVGLKLAKFSNWFLTVLFDRPYNVLLHNLTYIQDRWTCMKRRIYLL